MKKFRYKLDPLLKIRKFQEKQEFANYGRILGEINKYSEKIQETVFRKNDFADQERKNMQKGVFNISDKILAQDYYLQLKKIRIQAEKNIETRKDETEMLRKKAEKARQHRKVLEILREKKYGEYQLELAKVEYTNLDEFNQRKKRMERQ